MDKEEEEEEEEDDVEEEANEEEELVSVWSTVPSELINDGVTTDNGRGR